MKLIVLKKVTDKYTNEVTIYSVLKAKEEASYENYEDFLKPHQKEIKDLEKVISDTMKRYTHIETNPLFIGDLNTFKDVKKVVLKTSKTRLGSPVYRDYGNTLERQLKSLTYVNVCEDADTSWNTVKTALGARYRDSSCFGIVLATKGHNNVE